MLLQGGGGGDASSFSNAANYELQFEMEEVCIHVTFVVFIPKDTEIVIIIVCYKDEWLAVVIIT